ncbi:MAG: carbon-nitrogen hydrolase family protein [Bacteroidota bacterium]
MNICLAQIKPTTGDIHANIGHHQAVIEQAASLGADMLVFPELSLTSFEPGLANELAMDINDERLDIFQVLSNAHQLSIALGLPLRQTEGISISMLIFQPDQDRRMYSKGYLHSDEVPYFVPGKACSNLWGGQAKIAFAICYELSVPAHVEQAIADGARMYVASVAKFVNGVEAASRRLSELARRYEMPVLMCNCLGMADGGECAGQSAVWNREGELLGQLNESEEGMLLFDSTKRSVSIHYFSPANDT